MTALVLAAALLALQGEQDPALARFDALPVLRQAMVLRRAEQRVLASEDPAVQRIAMLHGDATAYPEPTPMPVFDPAEWAPGVAPERTMVPPTDPRHAAVRARAPRIDVLADLHKGVRYDWGRGTVTRTAAALTFRDRFANLLAGYVPGSDEAFAKVQAALDWDPAQEKLRAYFEHTYADVDAHVFEAVTIYEAWYPGEVLHMPDVDVIPFAVRVLGDKSYRSPIPADARRERLYAQIRDHALAYRQYKTTIEAAGAAFVRAEPKMDPMYARMVPRFHYLWKTNDDDIARVHGAITGLRTRERLIAEVDGTVTSDADAMARRDARRRELTAMAAFVRQTALAVLEESR